MPRIASSGRWKRQAVTACGVFPVKSPGTERIAGATLRTIGDRYGLSHEGVRFVVGDFRLGATLFVREGVNVRASDSDQDDFVRNRVTILGERRFGLAVWQLGAFALVHFASTSGASGASGASGGSGAS